MSLVEILVSVSFLLIVVTVLAIWLWSGQP
jgi:hypothetical protein